MLTKRVAELTEIAKRLTDEEPHGRRAHKTRDAA